MSAVTPHLEHVKETDTAEARAWDQSDRQRAEGADALGVLEPPLPPVRSSQASFQRHRELPQLPPSSPLPARTPIDRSRSAELELEPTEFEPTELPLVAGLHGLGASPATRAAKLTEESLWTSHAVLVRTAWIRHGMLEALVGRTITPTRVGDMPRREQPQGYGLDDIWLRVDPPVEPSESPGYAPASHTVSGVSLLSWTSKMDCPSFSLPAGPQQFDGSCPGSLGGQSLVPASALKRAQRVIAATHERARELMPELTDEQWAETASINLNDCICQHCYAEASHYQYADNQLRQQVRYLWTREAVAQGTFVDTMLYAIAHADFKLEGDRKLPPERFTDRNGAPRRFFRIHDSGDFFNKRYFEAWCAIARALPDVLFWAPTRIWAVSERLDWVRNVPRNLVLRPSSYMIDRSAALLYGLPIERGRYSAPSVSFRARPTKSFDPTGKQGYHWDCQAYAGKGEHSCRNALSPPEGASAASDGQTGCRACWIFPELAINYKTH